MQRFLLFPLHLPPHPWLPIFSIPHQNQAFATVHENSLTHQYHPKITVSIRVHSRILYGLDRWIMTYIHHYSFIQSFVNCLPTSVSFCIPTSTLAWKMPWMEEPGGLQSMGLLRVGHDWATSLSLFTFMHWRRKWQPTPVFLSGESQGWGSLVGCRLWGRAELDTTEATQQQQQQWVRVPLVL